jgi:predicted CXXCH cytochrome family protein
MDVLLRQLRQAADGAVEFQDTEVIADALSVGAAADCTIQLLGEGVAAHHATIRGRRAQLSIACHRRCKAVINGVSSASATLKIGDLIEIGGHYLRLVEPPSGFDIAIEIEPNAQAATSQYERAFRTDLSATWLSKRAAAWLLVALVLLAGLLIPYLSIAPQRAAGAAPPFAPTDQVWNAGPLIAAHQLAAGQRCGSCHQQIFVHARDSACRECHKSILDHVAKAHLAQSTLGPPQRCAECHREHHAPVTGLVVQDDRLCIDCHAKSEAEFGPLKVRPVTGFSRTAHPSFTVSLIKPGSALNASDLVDWVTRRETVATAREQSNLKFSHAQHLDPARVTRASDSRALGCSDCHTLDVDGEHFVPVSMQRSCASCHELTFDPGAPDRQLPHGKPRDAILLIQDYFARQAVDPSPTSSVLQRRRLPDQQLQETLCSGPALSCAKRRAQAEIENQFKTRGCASCHNVTDTHSDDVLDRFQVAPVRLTRDYFPDVHFSHRMHAVQKDKSGDAACQSCHAVRNSSSSADLFIPDLPKCLECHSERLEKDRVTLRCSNCHSYHPKTIIARNRETDVQ